MRDLLRILQKSATQVKEDSASFDGVRRYAFSNGRQLEFLFKSNAQNNLLVVYLMAMEYPLDTLFLRTSRMHDLLSAKQWGRFDSRAKFLNERDCAPCVMKDGL